MAKKTYTAVELVSMLRTKYGGSENVFCEQVANATGRDCYSWIDVMVIALWPSHGCSRTAIEVKVSRGDWMREAANPTKNAWCREYCHEFFYCAPPDVIKEEEVPAGAGLLIPFGSGLRIVRVPVRNVRAIMDDGFLAALARAFKKEHSRQTCAIKEELKTSDYEISNALLWCKAVNQFLPQRGQYPHFDKDEEADKLGAALKKLAAATSDKQTEKERARIVDSIQHFQNEMMQMFVRFANLAHISMLETDANGHEILSRYGDSSFNSIALDRLEKNLISGSKYEKESAAKELRAMRLLFEQARRAP